MFGYLYGLFFIWSNRCELLQIFRMPFQKFRRQFPIFDPTDYISDPPFVSDFFQVFVVSLKVHKIEIFFGFDFEICIISLLVMSKY
jgi:hypothetical protein